MNSARDQPCLTGCPASATGGGDTQTQVKLFFDTREEAIAYAERAGILLEVMRDLLYQTFVRKARLMQAMTFRRFVAPNHAEVG